MNLKDQLQLELDERGMTAAELARKSGVSKQVLSAWLGGAKPKNIEQLKKVADALRVSVDSLVFGDGNSHNEAFGLEFREGPEAGWIGGLFEVRFRRIRK